MDGTGLYAKGSKAWGLCRRCGLRDLLNNLLFDEYYPGMRVHPECKDYKHPQEHMVDVKDPIALWKPSPDDDNNVPPVLSGNQVTTTIHLSWTAATFFSGLVDHYNIYKSVNDADFELFASFLVTYSWDGSALTEILTDTDTAFTGGDKVDYYVNAVDINNRTLSSNVLSIQTS